jgi:peptide/nickel transport system permease protein
MTRYVVVRLLGAVPVLLLVTAVTFLAIRVIPGDLAQVRLGDSATPQDVRALRQELGLDEPLPKQYGEWGLGLLRGDPGDSLQSGLPVASQLRDRLPVTLELALVTTVLSILIALPLGIISAVTQGSIVDHCARVFAVLGQAVPSFWLAILALTFLSIYVHWAPPFAYRAPWEDPWHNVQQLLLPAVILAYAQSALLMRVVRSTMIEVLQQDYIRTAHSKGLGHATVVYRHAMRNALIPVLTVLGIQTGALIGGTIVLEQIFSLPGIGKLTLESIVSRDYTQLQFNVVFIAAMVVAINLLVDLSYMIVDPRVKAH